MARRSSPRRGRLQEIPESDYPVHLDLCIWPTEKESQFESFQAVLAAMLNAEDDSPYKLLAHKYGLNLEVKSDEKIQEYKMTRRTCIFYEKEGVYEDEETTHYTAMLRGVELNPYDYYQPPDTQGFCQMFAFFLATDQTTGFTEVRSRRSTSWENFRKYACNTLEVIPKLLNLLEIYNDVDQLMNRSFHKVRNSTKVNYGINCNSYKKFKDDLRRLTLNDAMYYIVDNPLPGNSDKTQFERLRNYIVGGVGQ